MDPTSLIIGGLAGGILSKFTQGLSFIKSHIKRKLVTTFEISSDSLGCRLFETWLSNISYMKECKILSSARSSLYTADKYSNRQERINQIMTNNLVPGLGIHYFKYNNVWCILYKTNTNKEASYPIHTYFITFFTRNKSTIESIFYDIYTSEDSDLDKTKIYEPDNGLWSLRKTIKNDKQFNYIYSNKLKNSVVQPINEFIKNKDKYLKLGLGHSLGIMLFGPPGTGKTTLAYRLAIDINYNLYNINLATHNLSDENLIRLFNSVSPNSIILIDDIDTVFTKRIKNETVKNTISFNSLLKLFDNLCNDQSRIVIITTNYPEKLDEALIRAGRIDIKEEVSFATPEQIIGLSSLFTSNTTDILNDFHNKNVSMSEVQNYLSNRFIK